MLFNILSSFTITAMANDYDDRGHESCECKVQLPKSCQNIKSKAMYPIKEYVIPSKNRWEKPELSPYAGNLVIECSGGKSGSEVMYSKLVERKTGYYICKLSASYKFNVKIDAGNTSDEMKVSCEGVLTEDSLHYY